MIGRATLTVPANYHTLLAGQDTRDKNCNTGKVGYDRRCVGPVQVWISKGCSQWPANKIFVGAQCGGSACSPHQDHDSK